MKRERSEEEEEAAAIARAVIEERDGVDVPAELIEERERRAAPPQESLWARVRAMSVGEKVKLALRGNQEARTLLLRDPNRVVQRLVLENPRLGEEEVLALARNRNTAGELLDKVAANRQWMRNALVRFALVCNPKTPLPTALRLLGSLGERELRRLAKSKDIPAAVAAQARRILLRRGAAR